MKASIAAMAAAAALAACSQPSDVVIEGGRVWDGGGFTQADIHIRGGRIVASGSSAFDAQRIDAAGRFITPAYANAHQHITSPTREANQAFLEAGVFYIGNPNLRASEAGAGMRAFFARPDTVDVVTALGGITEPGSHPEPLYVDILARRIYRGASYEDLYQDAFHYGRDPEEIEESLDRLVEQGADYVKIYLLGSEDYVAPDADGVARSATGLNPENLEHLVAEAHARGLDVAAHVETRSDVRAAAEAGVDTLAHIPGYSRVAPDEAAARTLTEADIEIVAAAGIDVIPTFALAEAWFDDALADVDGARRAELLAQRALTREIQRLNLRRLHEAGVGILMGTDAPPGLIGREAAHWVRLGALTPAETLTAVFRTGPALFPDRRIGCLDVGCEADLLILSRDPLVDVSAMGSIERRMKAGEWLESPAEADREQ